eukprot:3954950-Amphidinium_carterae.1
MALSQGILNYCMKDEDVAVSLDQFDMLVRQYFATTKKEIDDETKLAQRAGRTPHPELPPGCLLQIELKEILAARKYLSRDATELNALAKGKGKDKGNKGSPLGVTASFEGQ